MLVVVGEFVGAVVLVVVGGPVGGAVVVVGGSVGAVVLVVVSVDGAVLVVTVDESVVAAADVVESALAVAVGAVPTAVLLVAVGSPGSALPPMVVVVDALATASSTARSPSDPAHAEATRQRHATARSGPRPSQPIIWRCPPHPERREILHHPNGRDFPESPRCAHRVWGPGCVVPKECRRNLLVWRSLRS